MDIGIFLAQFIFIKELAHWLSEQLKINVSGQLFQWIPLLTKFLQPKLLIKKTTGLRHGNIPLESDNFYQ
jgi:hypothetical protein